METERITLTPFYLSLLLLMLAETAGAYITVRTGAFSLVMLGGIRMAEIAGLLAVFHFTGNGLSAIGLGRGRILSGLRRGSLWALGFAVAVLLGFALLALWGVNPLKLFHIRLPEAAAERWAWFIVGGLIGPVAEEMVFRGIFYGFFRRWGIAAALVLSTVMFVGLHGAFGLTQVVGGIVFAVAYEVEETLMAPVVIHVTGNMALFTLSFFA
ncbi:CPBP family intramembrane metalloprotease [Desulfonema ishimotonii]|uniref:CPBP family intramembrane metalloprotease n=1 Tax=Desulfonema ishimotonii TaxID=45657 RepID=A0A401FXK9_9BACT|nr:CPBP family intramembrane glutamic endopeptidase [Desulfonema ishimotonii]GBC61663.1 CPBP family intramembrane metalloprotease [Desulfonema ishimotonii]